MRDLKNLIFLLCLLALGSACGVKGDPVAPATPAEIGRGKPLFKSEEDDSSVIMKRKPPAQEQKEDQESDE